MAGEAFARGEGGAAMPGEMFAPREGGRAVSGSGGGETYSQEGLRTMVGETFPRDGGGGGRVMCGETFSNERVRATGNENYSSHDGGRSLVTDTIEISDGGRQGGNSHHTLKRYSITFLIKKSPNGLLKKSYE